MALQAKALACDLSFIFGVPVKLACKRSDFTKLSSYLQICTGTMALIQTPPPPPPPPLSAQETPEGSPPREHYALVCLLPTSLTRAGPSRVPFYQSVKSELMLGSALWSWDSLPLSVLGKPSLRSIL